MIASDDRVCAWTFAPTVELRPGESLRLVMRPDGLVLSVQAAAVYDYGRHRAADHDIALLELAGRRDLPPSDIVTEVVERLFAKVRKP